MITLPEDVPARCDARTKGPAATVDSFLIDPVEVVGPVSFDALPEAALSPDGASLYNPPQRTGARVVEDAVNVGYAYSG